MAAAGRFEGLELFKYEEILEEFEI